MPILRNDINKTWERVKYVDLRDPQNCRVAKMQNWCIKIPIAGQNCRINCGSVFFKKTFVFCGFKLTKSQEKNSKIVLSEATAAQAGSRPMGATSVSETIRESQWGEGSGGGTWWNNTSGGQSERGAGETIHNISPKIGFAKRRCAEWFLEELDWSA